MSLDCHTSPEKHQKAQHHHVIAKNYDTGTVFSCSPLYMSEELLEELEVLSAVYGDEFKYNSNARQCLFTLNEQFGELHFIIRVPEEYPETPPSVEAITCLLSGSGCSKTLNWDAKNAEVIARTLTISDAAQMIREMSENIGALSETENNDEAEIDKINPLQKADYVALIEDENCLQNLTEALLRQGFESYDNGIYFHVKTGIMMTLPALGGEVLVECPSRDKVELNYWMSITWPQLADGMLPTSRFVDLLIKLYKERPAPSGASAIDDTAEVDESDYSRYLPTPEDFGLEPKGSSRDLIIYTWGRQLRKQAPGDSQRDFNAAVLNGRGGGANLRRENGLCESVQNNVSRCALFPTWLEMVVSSVEKNNLTTISVACAKGRHRSVAAAELLKQRYYPNAKVFHLTIV